MCIMKQEEIIVIEYQNINSTSIEQFTQLSNAYCYLYQLFLEIHFMTDIVKDRLKIHNIRINDNSIYFELICLSKYTSFLNHLFYSVQTGSLGDIFKTNKVLQAIKDIHSIMVDKNNSKLLIGVKKVYTKH